MADKKRILIVDDDPDLLDLLQLDLAHHGYGILTASNGKDALRIATSEKIDLILLDVMMPNLDGYHVAQEITDNLGSKAPYIIIITGRDTAREKGMVLLSGAHEALQKPFLMEKLRERVAAALDRKP